MHMVEVLDLIILLVRLVNPEDVVVEELVLVEMEKVVMDLIQHAHHPNSIQHYNLFTHIL